MNNIIEDEYLMYNTSSRVPVCICIDSSATVAETPIMENILAQVEKGIKSFYAKVMADDMVCNCVEVAVVSYGDTVTTVQDYTCTSKYSNEVKIPVNSTVTGAGDIGTGITKALDLLELRKSAYNAHGVDYYRPWLIVITDGKEVRKEFKKSVALAKKKTLGLEKEKKLTLVTVYLNGNEGTDAADRTLAEITKKSKDKKVLFSKNIEPQILGISKISRLFDWLTDNVSKLAFENEIKLDFSSLTDWEDI